MPGAPAAQLAGTAARGGGGGQQARRSQPAADSLVAERVPASLASAFLALHGADVSDVPVRRGRAVQRQATRLGAAAFSHDGVVYLPDSAGSLGQASAQALLAHELTHAVQQRMLGAGVPGEASAEGRELEEQALATQRWFLGAADPVPALTLLPSGTSAQLTHAPAARHSRASADDDATGAFATGAHWTSGAHAASSVPGASGASAAVAQRTVQRQAAEAAPVVMAASTGTAPADGAAPAGPAGSAASAPASAPTADVHPGLAELKDQVAGLAGQRPAALDDPVELDRLAAKLYRRLRDRLRHELIVDRERAGLLTDFR